MNYQQAIEWLEALADPERHGFGRDFARRLNLDTTLSLMAGVGDPHQHLPCVHLAGTKGKGSVAAMVEAVARAAGHHTGLFTSPHQVSWRERIRLGGEWVSEAEVAELATCVRPVADQLEHPESHRSPTFFEACNAMALLSFARHQVDLAVIETGLGGRLDATNIVAPLVSVITTLGIEHSAILGETLPEIAREKAGIIKQGVPVVSAPQPPEAAEVLAEVARSCAAPLHLAAPFQPAGEVQPLRPEDVPSGEVPRPAQRARGSFAGETVELDLPLLGEHQLVNAGVTATVCELLAAQGLSIPPGALVRGLETVRWAARIELLEAHPWLVMDCAHNRDSASALARTLQRHLAFDRLLLVLGMYYDKQAEAIAQELAIADHVILTRAHLPRAMELEELTERTRDYWRSFEVVPQPARALRRARHMARPEDAICVTGSLSLTGEIVQELQHSPGRRPPPGRGRQRA